MAQRENSQASALTLMPQALVSDTAGQSGDRQWRKTGRIRIV
jgi:hypothetical protein